MVYVGVIGEEGWTEVLLRQKYSAPNRPFYAEVARWLTEHEGKYAVANMARPMGRRYLFADPDTAFAFKMRFG